MKIVLKMNNGDKFECLIQNEEKFKFYDDAGLNIVRFIKDTYIDGQFLRCSGKDGEVIIDLNNVCSYHIK